MCLNWKYSNVGVITNGGLGLEYKQKFVYFSWEKKERKG
jgi:hypothetical protein